MRSTLAVLLIAASVWTLPSTAVAEEARLDVLHVDLAVTLLEKGLEETVTIRAAGPVPPRWTLGLAEEMKVVSARASGKDIPVTRAGREATLDLSAVKVEEGKDLVVTLRVEGSPLEEQRSRGFVRSAIRPDVAYVRSQHPWYPRVADDPATYRVTVDTKAGWHVRTAGDFTKPATKGDRATWTFSSSRPLDAVGLVAGPYRQVVAPGGGKTSFDVLAFEGHDQAAATLAALAKRAFDLYRKGFGEVARSRMTLVEMPKEYGVGSGYGEYGYILLGTGAFEKGGRADWVPGFVAHEIAHTWWGSDVSFRHFASESLATYSTLKFLEDSEGPAAARKMRRGAVERVVNAARAGKEAAFADIRGWGAGMDPRTYRSHAYEKGMMVLAMVERAVGEKAMRRILARFFEENRGKRVDWSDLRAALAAGGTKARVVLEQWERPGIPTITATSETKKKGSSRTVDGKLVQSGTPKPFRMAVPVVVTCGEKRHEKIVEMKGAEARFTIRTRAEPDSVEVDPDYLVLADRSGGGPPDPERAWKEATAVSTSPNETDPARLARAAAQLRGLLESGESGHPGECHVHLGRILFRSGKIDEAKAALETGMRTGGFGPFTRSWAVLRLGCIADLQKRRKDAVSHYEAVVALPDRSNLAYQKKLAARFLAKPYR